MKFPNLLPEIAALDIAARERLVDNVMFWALVEHITHATTDLRLNDIAQRIISGYCSGKLTQQQFQHLCNLGGEKRADLHRSSSV